MSEPDQAGEDTFHITYKLHYDDDALLMAITCFGSLLFQVVVFYTLPACLKKENVPRFLGPLAYDLVTHVLCVDGGWLREV